MFSKYKFHLSLLVLLAVIFGFAASSALAAKAPVKDALTWSDVKTRFEADMQPAQDLEALSAVPCTGGSASGYPCSNVDLLSFMPLNQLGGTAGNDIWGWSGCGGRDFALMGLSNGTVFVEITDPMNPVRLGNLPSATGNSSWRDVKTNNDHAYIVSEAFNHGMQVFDLSRLCDVNNPPVTFNHDARYTGFGSAHNVVINERSDYAYGVGASSCSGGLHMVDISNPTSPSNAGCYSGDGYTHDAQCVNYRGPDADWQGSEICFNSNEDTLTIVDVTNKAAPQLISRTGYPGDGYTHQGWLAPNQRWFVLDDELDETSFGHNTRTRFWNVQDLDAPFIAITHDAANAAIDHNLYIRNGFIYQANYRSGLRILGANGGNPIEVAFFDIYPANDNASFNGAWSNFPFPNGMVIVSGIEQGLFVLQPTVTQAQAGINWNMLGK